MRMVSKHDTETEVWVLERTNSFSVYALTGSGTKSIETHLKDHKQRLETKGSNQ